MGTTLGCAMQQQFETREHNISLEDLKALADRFFTRDTIQAELISLLGQFRQIEERALDLPAPDGILLSAIIRDLDDRVSSRLNWLLQPEKRSPLLESALVCHVLAKQA